ncbi:hypothetical protein LX70_00602 [Defluviimonas denitrificans]|uniref:Uncharacterized protein n=1 Tax=Albidovulum denitrificans TaxID=404881 RepID=A0A2S8SDM5_9RHOB|nr:hypothetical protein [Defluviimonas denitrificans]PQV58788.1 hypothetical protein LX70_00602 [Defluviimonas denitrificans]
MSVTGQRVTGRAAPVAGPAAPSVRMALRPRRAFSPASALRRVLGRALRGRLRQRGTLAVALMALAVWAAPLRAGPDDLVFPAPVTISAEDIAWFRTATVTWIDMEAGAPAILLPGDDPDFASDVPPPGERRERIFLAFALYGDLPPGSYDVPAMAFLPPLAQGYLPPTRITVTAEHRQLLRAAWWRQTVIDPKYPYGSYGFYEADMAHKLGTPPPIGKDGVFDMTEAEIARMRALHRDLQAVLAVWVTQARLAPGTYQLPVDGWETYSGLRLSPPSASEIARYMDDWRALSTTTAVQTGQDRGLRWMEINARLAGAAE